MHACCGAAAAVRVSLSKIIFMCGSSRMRSLDGSVSSRLSSITLFIDSTWWPAGRGGGAEHVHCIACSARPAQVVRGSAFVRPGRQGSRVGDSQPPPLPAGAPSWRPGRRRTRSTWGCRRACRPAHASCTRAGRPAAQAGRRRAAAAWHACVLMVPCCTDMHARMHACIGWCLCLSGPRAHLPLARGHVDKAVQLLRAHGLGIDVADDHLLAVGDAQVVVDRRAAANGDRARQHLRAGGAARWGRTHAPTRE